MKMEVIKIIAVTFLSSYLLLLAYFASNDNRSKIIYHQDCNIDYECEDFELNLN